MEFLETHFSTMMRWMILVPVSDSNASQSFMKERMKERESERKCVCVNSSAIGAMSKNMNAP
jgi:hypothetical protein